MSVKVGTIVSALGLGFGALPKAYADTPQPLAQTQLYAAVVRGCHSVDLDGWKHPARKILEAAGARVDAVQLCNNGGFPVFTVTLKYDPQTGPNRSRYDRLYVDLANANGWWSYALVDETDRTVITVTVDRMSHAVHVGTETYDDTSTALPKAMR